MRLKNIVAALCLSTAILFNSCTTEEYITQEHITNVEGGNAYIFSTTNIEIKNWKWNSVLNRYESEAVPIEGLNMDIFEYGKVMVDMFWLENFEGEEIEVIHDLPFEQNFYINGKDDKGKDVKIWDYTQRISYNMTVDDIVFYIESTKDFVGLDLTRYFKVVVLWDGIIEDSE